MSTPSTNGQATLSDLKEVLKDTLEARGSLNQIKARIRAEIFAALDDHDVPKPKLSNENLIINELIREYFEYNEYRHALSVFLPESGQPTEKPFHREFLSGELNITEDPRFAHVPLLYSIVAGLQQSREKNVINQHTESFGAHGEHVPSPLASSVVERNTSRESPSHLSSIGGTKEPSPLMFKK